MENMMKTTCCHAYHENNNNLPVAIIGAGPIGLAAAAHLIKYKQPFIIFESGPTVGTNILTWSHVQLFSPWRYNIDKAALSLLMKYGWKTPELEDLPTGRDLIHQYLIPLSETHEIKKSLLLNTKVVAIGKRNIDKMKTLNRESEPFLVFAEENGDIKRFEVGAVIDASGTWGNPNPANSSGVWLKDEQSLSKQFFYGIPDIFGKDKSRYINKRVAIVGGGHSAMNSLLDLVKLKEDYPLTEIFWIMRKENVEETYGGEELDALEARGKLGSRIRQIVDADNVKVVTPFMIQNVESNEGKIKLVGFKKGEMLTINNLDEVIVNTGNRPDFSFLREVRTSIDPVTESVKALAPLIDPNIHSCGTVRPHGEKELRQPDKNFYIVGSKSYGRAPTFLLATGYEQVRSVVAYLSGDFGAAEKVELDLPETGVCKTNLFVPQACCS